MNTTIRQINHTAAANAATTGTILAALFAASAGVAAEPDTSDWACESCPFQTGYQAEYTFGATGVSDDAAHFGSASGYDESGAYLNVDGHGSYVDGSYRMLWTLEDLGLDSRALALEGGRPGSWDYRMSLRELPYRQFDTTRSVHRQAGDGVLALPSDWVRNAATASLPGLATSLSDVRIGHDRETLGLGGSYALFAGIELFADYRHEEREGTDFTSGAYYTHAVQLPRPFEYETDEVNVGVRYNAANGFVALAWHGSSFAPETAGFSWENPFTSAAGAEINARAEPPENSFQQIALSGNYRFGVGDAVAAFSASFGSQEQDGELLAYTTNANLVTPLPRTALDGEVDTTHFSLSVTGRPHSRARLRFAYSMDERDNQTPVEEWSRVIVDSFTSGEIETNVPYGFERSRIDLRADVDVIDSLVFSAGYEYRELDRSLQEVAEQSENTGWGKLRWRPSAFIDVSARAGQSKREVDRYDTDFASVLGQNPLLRKYNLAYRFREFGDLTVAASLPDKPLSATLNLMLADDSYTHSQLGLLASDDVRGSLDVDWAINDRTSLYVSGGYEQIESRQAGSEAFAEPDWQAHNEDEFHTLAGGIRVNGIKDRVDLTFDYTRTMGTGRITVDSGNDAFERFPDLESDLDAIRLDLRYRHSDKLETSLTVRFESFSAQDWALQGVAPDTIPTVLALGAEPYDYDVLLFGARFRYLFGTRSIGP